MNNYIHEIVSQVEGGKKAVPSRREDGKTLISVYTWVRQERYSAEYHELGIDDVGRWQFYQCYSIITNSNEAALMAAKQLLAHQALAMAQD